MEDTVKPQSVLTVPSTSEIGENAFNAIRFFCCLIVIVGHCFDMSHTPFTYRSFIDMHIFVCIFFILSVFGVTKSLLSRISVIAISFLMAFVAEKYIQAKIR